MLTTMDTNTTINRTYRTGQNNREQIPVVDNRNKTDFRIKE